MVQRFRINSKCSGLHSGDTPAMQSNIPLCSAAAAVCEDNEELCIAL